MARRAALGLVSAAVLGSATTAVAGPISRATDDDTVPLPLAQPLTATQTFPGLGLRPDRRLVSHAPGSARTRERVAVSLDGRGVPHSVVLREHLRLGGTGDYLIYERGPARAAAPIGDSVPPVLKLGTVIWQGFSPGRRDLAAELRLDAALEAARLPLKVTLTWRGADGDSQPLGPDGRTPGPGTVTVQLTNTTSSPQTLPTGLVDAADLAGPLDRLRRTADTSARLPQHPFVIPVAGRELPATVPMTAPSTTAVTTTAPLRVSGTITAPGTSATLSGPTATTTPGGGAINGVLAGGAEFTLGVASAARIDLDLTAVPSLDPRTLTPPDGSPTWAAWAQTDPSPDAERAATDRLVVESAAAARAAELSPYVGSDLEGLATTAFRYRIAPPAAAPAAAGEDLEPRPLALAIAGLLGLALVVGAALVWRRS